MLHLATATEGAMSRPLANHRHWSELTIPDHRNVLLGIPDPTNATAFAQAARYANLEPALALTPAMLLERLRSQAFDLVVIHPCLLQATPGGRRLLDAVAAQGCPLLVLAPEPTSNPTSSAGPAAQELLSWAARLLPARTAAAEQAGCVSWGPLRLDLCRRQAWWGAAPLELTPAQFRIVVVLISAAGAVVTNHELARRVWGSEGHLDGERIFAHIRRIRKKIEPDPTNPSFLLTVRGEGFRLAPN